MDRRSFSRSLLAASSATSALAVTRSPNEGKATAASVKTINFVGKEEQPFLRNAEAELAAHKGAGYLNHMWFGGSFENYTHLRLRVYVDHEISPAINMELGLGVGVGFADPSAPWGTKWGGITGYPSGIFFNYRIPFSTHIRITAELPPGAPRDVPFWWIIRGIENRPLEVAGFQLAANARLKLYRVEDLQAQPFEFFDLCRVKGSGMIFQVTIAAKSTNLNFLEAQMRAYVDDANEPEFLSSGLEDYFLGTYYFNRGTYHLDQAGLTHKNDEAGSFSAYRYHDEDPIVFNSGIRLVCRCGEMRGDKRFGNPQPTTYTAYTWVYEW